MHTTLARALPPQVVAGHLTNPLWYLMIDVGVGIVIIVVVLLLRCRKR